MVGKVGALHPGEGFGIKSIRRDVKKLLPQASTEELKLRVQERVEQRRVVCWAWFYPN